VVAHVGVFFYSKPRPSNGRFESGGRSDEEISAIKLALWQVIA
jgi:hypothetical protein